MKLYKVGMLIICWALAMLMLTALVALLDCFFFAERYRQYISELGKAFFCIFYFGILLILVNRLRR
jgi:hypothetical protein